MNEILINKEKLADKIIELEKLRDLCNSHSSWKKEEIKFGSGEVIDIINSLDKEQIMIMEAFDNLLNCTINYFKIVEKSISEADDKAANNFK